MFSAPLKKPPKLAPTNPILIAESQKATLALDLIRINPGKISPGRISKARNNQSKNWRSFEICLRETAKFAHEQAHASVGGQYAGAASFTYQRGPDGVRYGVGGEVAISAPTGGDPQTRLQAAEQIKRAALAPANPSTQDRQVAAQAGLTATQARTEIASQKSAERAELSEEKSTPENEDSTAKVTDTPDDVADRKNTSADQAFKNVKNASDLGSLLNRLA